MQTYPDKNIRHNFTVNILDGAFFGFAFGFASLVTIVPLFLRQMTDSAILIGLIPTFHWVGWQVPQLFTAGKISQLKRYKPFVLWMTIHERLPFLGLAVIAWFAGKMDVNLTIFLLFLMLAWQGLGAGFTANAWQTMVAKLFPPHRRGTFLGAQYSAFSVLSMISVVTAGLLLEKLDSPYDFTLCFLLASFCMVISFVFLALTRESPHTVNKEAVSQSSLWKDIWGILRKNTNFQRLLIGRSLTQFGFMAFAFTTIYAVDYHGMSEAVAGIMAGILSLTVIVAGPIIGMLGDRWGHRTILAIGGLAASLSAVLAILSPSLIWFTLVFILTGIASVTTYTSAMGISMEFGDETTRPLYIGMANTLVAPSAFLAPVLGGWLADNLGYPTTFSVSAIFGLITLVFFILAVKDPAGAGKIISQED